MPELENHLVAGGPEAFDRDLARFYGEWPEDDDGEPVDECPFVPGKPCNGCQRCERRER